MKHELSTAFQYWVDEVHVIYVTDRQTNITKMTQFRWRNVFQDMCRMVRWSSWSWFDVNRSTILTKMCIKNNFHVFLSQWPWRLTFIPQICSTSYPCPVLWLCFRYIRSHCIRLSNFDKIGGRLGYATDGQTDRRDAVLNAAPLGRRPHNNATSRESNCLECYNEPASLALSNVNTAGIIESAALYLSRLRLCAFLADRTNPRAYATVLRLSVDVCDVMYCGPIRGLFAHTWLWAKL